MKATTTTTIAALAALLLLSGCGSSRTDGMTCGELRADNLSMVRTPANPTPSRPYDLDRVRENNSALEAKGCA